MQFFYVILNLYLGVSSFKNYKKKTIAYEPADLLNPPLRPLTYSAIATDATVYNQTLRISFQRGNNLLVFSYPTGGNAAPREHT